MGGGYGGDSSGFCLGSLQGFRPDSDERFWEMGKATSGKQTKDCAIDCADVSKKRMGMGEWEEEEEEEQGREKGEEKMSVMEMTEYGAAGVVPFVCWRILAI